MPFHRGDSRHHGHHSQYSQQQSSRDVAYNGRHLLLEQVYEELKKEEHRSWISKV